MICFRKISQTQVCKMDYRGRDEHVTKAIWEAGAVVQAGNDSGLDQGVGSRDGEKGTHLVCILELEMAGQAEAQDDEEEGKKGTKHI